MTIDDRLAFGEYVSLPIRTEKTAEEKWIELRKWLNAERVYLKESHCEAKASGNIGLSEMLSARYVEIALVLINMEELDT